MVGRYAGERIALVVTVLNEASTIDTLLESIAAQTARPDVTIVVDGGSTDGTWQRLQTWTDRLPLRLVHSQGANIALGRNLAVAATDAELIAATDAGVRLEPYWLANLKARLTPEVDVVSGFFVPDVHSSFETAMAATVLPTTEDVQPSSFLPSSRSLLFRRSAWEGVGGYPEWLDYCEDLVFDFALKRAGCRFVFASDAVVHFRPRGSLAAFFRQYFLYARGDGKADLWRLRHAIRYATYLTALALLPRGPLARLVLLVAALAYVRRPYERLVPLLRACTARDVASAVMLVPVIRLTGDIAKMLGYPVGVWWRWTSRSSS